MSAENGGRFARPQPAPLAVIVLSEDAILGGGLSVLLGAGGRIRGDCVTALDELEPRLTARRAQVVIWLAEHAEGEPLREVAELRSRHEVVVCIVAQSIDFRALREALSERPDGLAVLLRHDRIQVADISRTLVQLMAGRVVLSPTAIEQLIVDPPGTRERMLLRLTTHELAVLELMSKGLRNRAIAERLQRSEKLVEKHVGRIFSKLDLDTEAHPELAACARRACTCSRAK